MIQATCGTGEILAAARGLLRTAEPLIAERGLTMIGLSVSGLSADDAIQLALPFDEPDRDALDTAIDRVRARFGNGAMNRARLLGRSNDDFLVPSLPD
jgi:DNA polymerase-4